MPKLAQSTDEETADVAASIDGEASDEKKRFRRQAEDHPAAVLGKGERLDKVEVLVSASQLYSYLTPLGLIGYRHII